MKNIILIGIMGCGKSTIGKVLAEKSKKEFIDMDEYIEKISNQTIKKLFEKGEENFRLWESKACEELSKKEGIIIACGGGVIKKNSNIKLLNKNGIIIYLERSIESILEDIDISNRPLLKEGKEVLYKLHEEREGLYKMYSDYIINNDNGIDYTISKIKNINIE